MKHLTNFEDILVEKYGQKGTSKRDAFDADSLAFRLGVMLKEARKEANLTQEELPLLARGFSLVPRNKGSDWHACVSGKKIKR